MKLDLKPTVQWHAVAQLSAHVTRDGFEFAAAIHQFGGTWNAIGVVSPVISGPARATPEGIVNAVFAQHGHQFIASSPDLAEVQARCAEFCLNAPVPTEHCPCPDLGAQGPRRQRARTAATP